MKRPGIETKKDVGSESVDADDTSEEVRSWRDEANCEDADIDQMFGDPEEIGKDMVKRQQKLARIALCGECEVEPECLEAAMKEEQLGDKPKEIGVYGVRGGMTESERREYYKRLRRSKNKQRKRTRVA